MVILISLLIICVVLYLGFLTSRTLLRTLKASLVITYQSIFMMAVVLFVITAIIYIIVAINLSALHASPPETPYIGWLLFLFLTVLPVAGLLFFRSYQKAHLDPKKTGVHLSKTLLLSSFVIFILIWIAVTVVVSGRVAMILALKSDKVDTVKFLLNSGMSARMTIVATGEKRYPLHYAALKGSTEMTRLLIARGADVHVEGVLIDAIIGGNPDVVQMLLQAGTDPNQDSGYRSPLMWAVEKRNAKMVNLLLDHGANINFINTQDMTALDMAREKGDQETAQLLLSRGAREKLSSAIREKALFSAIEDKDMNKMQLILNKGADINCLNELRQTPLIRALIFKNSEAAMLLLKHGAKVDIRDVNGNDALDIAQKNNDADIENILFKHGAQKTRREK
ncbi:MAG TPA: ankyrin repeat domain-containing protein [Smithella sp.]|nr:ankyrin repeat domain-containing protein [Smithella sp.]